MWLICRVEWWSRVYWIIAALKRIGFPLNRPVLIIRPRNMIRSLIQLTEQYRPYVNVCYHWWLFGVAGS